MATDAEKKAAAAEREAIKVVIPEPVKDKKIEDIKPDDDVNEDNEDNENSEIKDGTETVKETVKDNKETIKESEKTQEQLEAEKADAKTTAEKARIQKRIDKEVAKRKEVENENVELKKQLAAKDSEGDKFTKEDLEKEAKRLADLQVNEREYLNACSSLEKNASKLDKKFIEKINTMVDDLGKENYAIPRDMIVTCNDFDNGAEVLVHLANDVDEYERLVDLTPIKRASELTKISLKLATPKPKIISKVPNPIQLEEGGSIKDTPLRDNEPMEDWIRKRNKQAAQHSANKRR